MLKPIRKFLTVLLLLWPALAGSASGAELSGERIRTELDSLYELRESVVARRDSIQKQADELAAEVARLKQSLAERFSRLEEYRLEGVLKSVVSIVVEQPVQLFDQLVCLGQVFRGDDPDPPSPGCRNHYALTRGL